MLKLLLIKVWYILMYNLQMIVFVIKNCMELATEF